MTTPTCGWPQAHRRGVPPRRNAWRARTAGSYVRRRPTSHFHRWPLDSITNARTTSAVCRSRSSPRSPPTLQMCHLSRPQLPCQQHGSERPTTVQDAWGSGTRVDRKVDGVLAEAMARQTGALNLAKYLLPSRGSPGCHGPIWPSRTTQASLPLRGLALRRGVRSSSCVRTITVKPRKKAGSTNPPNLFSR